MGRSIGGVRRRRSQTSVKHEAILDAATGIFLSVGYSVASMDAITQVAGVSKATIYSHFANKEVLFGSIIKAQCQQLLSPMLTSDIRAREPDDALRAFADRFMELVMSETALALYRVVMAEAPRFPELARAFYDNGPAQAISNLSTYLSEQTSLGRLDVSDPTNAAEQFLSLLTGYLHVRTALRIMPGPKAPDISEHISSTVSMFLRAYGHDTTDRRSQRS